MESNIILDKSKAFALRIIKIYQYLCEEKKEFILSKQILRSGTMYIAYKEANETEYWLELLHESGYIEKAAFESIYFDCKEIIKILASITKNSKK